MPSFGCAEHSEAADVGFGGSSLGRSLWARLLRHLRGKLLDHLPEQRVEVRGRCRVPADALGKGMWMIGMSRFGAPHEHLALAGGQVVVVLDVVRDCRCFLGAEAAAVGEHPANVLQVLMEVLEALARVFPT